VFGRIVRSSCDQELNLTILGREFVIPPRSTFLLSNLCQITPLYNYTACNGKYDLIVIDPPWENRSAIRGRKYEWLPTERLPELSIQRLAAKGALVAVWVTNKRKLTMFIRQKLFPKWNICYQAEWHWLKFTTGGDLIHEMDSVHKKPYEVVVIGRYMETSSDSSDSTPPPKRICLESSDSNLKTDSEFGGDQFTEPESGIRNSDYSYSPPNDVEFCTEKRPIRESSSHEEPVHPEIIKNFVFACVASQAHSQKPYLGDILDKYCTKQGRKLELFARNLLPGWTSWGNEVLLFQVPRESTDYCVYKKHRGIAK
jgi:N6-adenosine-specific RNA methylase IME4